MYCKNCGDKIDDDSKFCTKCGNKIQNPQVKERASLSINKEPIAQKKNTLCCGREKCAWWCGMKMYPKGDNSNQKKSYRYSKEENQQSQETAMAKKSWWKLTSTKGLGGYIVAGSIWYFSERFRKTSIDGIIVFTVAIAAWFFYYRLKSKIKIKNEAVRIIIVFFILEIISGVLIGFSTSISDALTTRMAKIETSPNSSISAPSTSETIDWYQQYLRARNQPTSGTSGIYQQYLQLRQKCADLVTQNNPNATVDWYAQLQGVTATNINGRYLSDEAYQNFQKCMQGKNNP